MRPQFGAEGLALQKVLGCLWRVNTRRGRATLADQGFFHVRGRRRLAPYDRDASLIWANIGVACCERNCERNAAQRPGYCGTRRDGLDTRLFATCAFETCDVTRNGDRLAHNPEVAGSNPVPDAFFAAR